MDHIHSGKKGVSGPIVVALFKSKPQVLKWMEYCHKEVLHRPI